MNICINTFYLSLRPTEQRNGELWPFIYSIYGLPIFMDKKNIINKLAHKIIKFNGSTYLQSNEQTIFNKQTKDWI